MRGKPSWPLVSALLFLGLTSDEVSRHLGLRVLIFWRAKTGGVVRVEDVPSWAWKRASGWVSEERKGVALAEMHKARARSALATYAARAVRREV